MNKRLVLTACFLTVFVAYAINYGYGILLPEMLTALDISKTDAGIINSVFFIAYTLASPLCGYIADRFGSRWLLSSFVMTMGIGAFFMSRATSVLTAAIFFGVAGIGSAARWAPVMALAQKWSDDAKRGKTLSFIDIGTTLSLISIGALLPVIIREFDWRAAWMILGIAGMFAAVFNFLVVKNPPTALHAEAIGTSTTIKKASLSITSLLSNGKFWIFGLAYLVVGIAYPVPFTFLTTYAVQELSFDYNVAASLVTVIGIGGIISKLTLGPLSDKAGRLKIILLSSFLTGLGSLGLVFGKTVSPFIPTLIFGIGYGIVFAMYAAAASDYFSKDSAGTVIGLWTIFMGIGLMISPAVSGWLADATGTLSWSFVMSAAGMFLSMLLLVPFWKMNRR